MQLSWGIEGTRPWVVSWPARSVSTFTEERRMAFPALEEKPLHAAATEMRRKKKTWRIMFLFMMPLFSRFGFGVAVVQVRFVC